jgi:transcriptional regulator with XRE-family HTH domain
MLAISAKRNFKGINQAKLADLVRTMLQCLVLSQAKFAALLGISYQSVNPWENKRTKPLPIASLHRYVLALKQIEHLLHQMGDFGNLLTKHFSWGRRLYD